MPPKVIAPVVAVEGVSPVDPALNEATVFAVVASVPLVGSVTDVVPVVVRVALNAPLVASVLLFANAKVPVVVLIVRPLTLVAVATPSVGVVRMALVVRAMPPDPLTADPRAVMTPVPSVSSPTTVPF